MLWAAKMKKAESGGDEVAADAWMKLGEIENILL